MKSLTENNIHNLSTDVGIRFRKWHLFSQNVEEKKKLDFIRTLLPTFRTLELQKFIIVQICIFTLYVVSNFVHKS